ncbi:MAG: 3-oxoacyl-ACP synthase [Verrucomicrobiales bacterium]|nr:3-oxoacyl-ACP synthase [Verrucomicrobiales bacterium]
MLFPRPTGSTPPARVVITGVGIITSLGCGWKQNADGFRSGRRAFRGVTLFDVSRHRTKIAAEADIPTDVPLRKLHARAAHRLDRASKLLLTAADEAVQQSKIDFGAASLHKTPIVLGTTSGGMGMGESYYRTAIDNPLVKAKQATRILQYLAQTQIAELAEALGIAGQTISIANACASGSNAVGHAFEMVRDGRADVVVTGGYDALCEMVFTGFDSLQALSQTQCRPFDSTRDGLALGEGAAVFIFESAEHAKARCAKVIGEIVGYGAATDCHHLTQPQPEGNAALASMTAACKSAGLSPEQIGYINAHGTGTPLNDSAEANAISRWAGEVAPKIHVSSTKASIGHLLGAAGAVETAICLMALQGQWLPPMTSTQTADAACKFSLVLKPTDAPLEYALSNSFGFGGANASVIFRRAE